MMVCSKILLLILGSLYAVVVNSDNLSQYDDLKVIRVRPVNHFQMISLLDLEDDVSACQTR